MDHRLYYFPVEFEVATINFHFRSDEAFFECGMSLYHAKLQQILTQNDSPSRDNILKEISTSFVGAKTRKRVKYLWNFLLLCRQLVNGNSYENAQFEMVHGMRKM